MNERKGKVESGIMFYQRLFFPNFTVLLILADFQKGSLRNMLSRHKSIDNHSSRGIINIQSLQERKTLKHENMKKKHENMKKT